MSIQPLVRLENIIKNFGPNEVLKGVDLEVSSGEVVCILGPSGSGKSTLLRCINFIEQPTAGLVFVGDEVIGHRRTEDPEVLQQVHENAIARQRSEIGMVFQRFNLFPHMTVLENITHAPRLVRGHSVSAANETAMALLEKVGLADRATAYPRQLSGGQQQRVAIARAIVGQPRILLADEPTGNLDSQMGDEIMEILHDLNRKDGTTIVMVTHDDRFARRTDRIVRLFDGRQVA